MDFRKLASDLHARAAPHTLQNTNVKKDQLGLPHNARVVSYKSVQLYIIQGIDKFQHWFH